MTVLQYTRELHRAGAAHIAEWEKDPRGRDLSKIYKLGVGRDKPRQKKTQAERQIAYRAKKKQIKIMELIQCSARSAVSAQELSIQGQTEMELRDEKVDAKQDTLQCL